MRAAKYWSAKKGERICACGCGVATPSFGGFGKSYNMYATERCRGRVHDRKRPIPHTLRASRIKASLKHYYRVWGPKRAAARAEARKARGWPPYGSWESKWTASIKKKYGMERCDYDRLLLAQSGICPICSGQMKRPHVDHDHDTGVVRGLLCHACNKGLGQFRDDQQLLIQAVRYLGDARRNSLKLA